MTRTKEAREAREGPRVIKVARERKRKETRKTHYQRSSLVHLCSRCPRPHGYQHQLNTCKRSDGPRPSGACMPRHM
ncbi:hypothetical protein GBAR_LOCUS15256 [Geodia barretti]|uniref:Uncharacterized protein n=1 Tax=Geodia barretti TaxID=519541 RepID=A0AA35SCC7_GEOBA|nr:hypothetical protein GBAR_LOCUS15256 [Geodia barretti]